MSDIKFFDSNDEMFNYLKEESEKALEWAERCDAVSLIDSFNYFCLVAEGMLIVGVKQPAVLPKDQYDSEEEYNWEVEGERDNKRHGYVFARWYSLIVPEGELGGNHLSKCYPLPDDIGKAIVELISSIE
jgi:hypothetical protein